MIGLAPEIESVRRAQPMRVCGSVAALRGLSLLVEDLALPAGSLVRIDTARDAGAGERLGEVVGFDGGRAIVMTLGATSGLRAGDRVVGLQSSPTVRVGRSMLGRVMDGLGRPIDQAGPLAATAPAPLIPEPLSPMRRGPIESILPTGVRTLDLMTTVGRGQRMGVFAGPGVGKSTLLGMIARRTRADVNVVALVGERGREVGDFLSRSLGPEGLARSAVFVATSDESPLLRIRAALAACAAAERFRDEGADVMLLIDSITRLAQAQRQVGLTVGEPPATKGYTPSVFAMLPSLLERAGAVHGSGSITGFYTILVEGDDMTEPVSDAVRGILDGHLVLSRDLARRHHFPAIDALDSISRAAADIIDPEHAEARATLVRLLAAHRDVEELVQIGAYARGSNPEADVALALRERIEGLLTQGVNEHAPFERSREELLALAREARSMLDAARRRAN